MHALKIVRSPAATRLWLLAALFVLLAILGVQRASAGTYTVAPCETATHPGLDIETGSVTGFFNRDRCGIDGTIVQSSGLLSGTQIHLSAPDGTTITNVHLDRELAGTIDPQRATGDLEWVVADEKGLSGHLYDNVDVRTDDPLPSGPTDYANPGASLNNIFRCPGGCTSQTLHVTLSDISATLDDRSPPTISKFAAPTDPVRGTAMLSIGGSDRGGGIFGYSILVDGNTSSIVHLSNGGDCDAPFTLLTPCATSLDTTVPFDTTRLQPGGEHLSDGRHTVELILTDIGGNPVRSASVPITLHNAPESTSAPVISGKTEVGAQLSFSPGSWLGSPTLAYQWRRCPGDPDAAATMASCVPIQGETNSTYVLTDDDLSHRMAVSVTATNFAGSDPVLSQPTGPVTPPLPPSQGPTLPSDGGNTLPPLLVPAPLLSATSLSRTRFRVGAGGGSLLRLASSEAGQLSLAIERARPGQKVRRGGKLVCKPVRRAPRRGRCTVYARAGTLVQTIGAGRVTLVLSGRIGSRKLAAGSYRVTVTERDGAGYVSKPVRLSFTILAG